MENLMSKISSMQVVVNQKIKM